ncbi:hypothetical protein ACRRTK_005347 [Alexandromys fortis]
MSQRANADINTASKPQNMTCLRLNSVNYLKEIKFFAQTKAKEKCLHLSPVEIPLFDVALNNREQTALSFCRVAVQEESVFTLSLFLAEWRVVALSAKWFAGEQCLRSPFPHRVVAVSAKWFAGEQRLRSPFPHRVVAISAKWFAGEQCLKRFFKTETGNRLECGRICRMPSDNNQTTIRLEETGTGLSSSGLRPSRSCPVLSKLSCPGQDRAGQGQPGQSHRWVQVSCSTRVGAPLEDDDSGPAVLELLQLNRPEMALLPWLLTTAALPIIRPSARCVHTGEGQGGKGSERKRIREEEKEEEKKEEEKDEETNMNQKKT